MKHLFKFKPVEEEENTNIENEQPKTKEIIEDKEEWIWVEGYKALRENSSTGEFFGYNNCVFELNKEYECQVETENGRNVFQFYKNLIDTKNSYNPICGWSHTSGYAYQTPSIYNKTKHFLVKAYVKKSDWDKQCNKYVAKKIILTEQVSVLEVWNTFNINEIKVGEYYIKSFEDFELFHSKISIDSFMNILKQREIAKNTELLKSKGYSNTFSMLISEQYGNKVKQAVAYADEGLSVDMRAYLLLKGE